MRGRHATVSQLARRGRSVLAMSAVTSEDSERTRRVSDWLLGGAARNVKTMPRVVANTAVFTKILRPPSSAVRRSKLFVNRFEISRPRRYESARKVKVWNVTKEGADRVGEERRGITLPRPRFKRIRGKLAAISAPIYRRGIVESCGDAIRG